MEVVIYVLERGIRQLLPRVLGRGKSPTDLEISSKSPRILF